ncbi:MAG: DUF333 domain-containing protein [Candidatus Aenigmatarchaeota archaeon]
MMDMKRTKPFAVLGLAVLLLATLVAKTVLDSGKRPDGAAVGMANPAATKCVNDGLSYEVRDGPDGQYGICRLEDGTECGEWAYFRGECGI